MRKIIILAGLLCAAPAFADAPDNTEQGVVTGYQSASAAINALAPALTALVADRDKLKADLAKAEADAAYWKTACDKTPECSGKPNPSARNRP